ncbi:hypothetical protein [Salisediminibacterium beveridgei]|uniref:Uncharacterized protein n=1 Tax=Salisediminibacterium beveridgei TaxID=632773 RepID=A0A1D7QVB3_9BACI|nr:hypothetical protein [Salisediminibacterium beveridgei]AOM82950.1 hypothetical protein BBEV_1589 [Salisediminibacterium beveridgei]
MKQINAIVKEISQEGYVTLLAKSLSKEWTLEMDIIPVSVQIGSWLQLTLDDVRIVMIEMDQEDIVASRIAVDRKWQRLQDKRKKGN